MSDWTPRTFHVIDVKSRARIAGLILKLNPDQEWDITIRKHVKLRTLKQNARLHLIFTLVAQETGNTIDDVKDGYKALFTKAKVVKLGKRRLMVYPQTSKMNVAQLNDFMTQCEEHAISNFGVVLGDY
jgi:hypothetical protein